MPEHESRYTYDHPLVPYAVQYTPLSKMNISEEDDAISEDLYRAVEAGDRRAVKPLKEMIRKYPNEPMYQNHLYNMYAMSGRWKEAETVLRELRERHPHYLFGLVNEAGWLIGSEDDTAAARQLLGERLLLQDLYPERDVFHITEVVSYYRTAIMLLLKEGNVKMAKERHIAGHRRGAAHHAAPHQPYRGEGSSGEYGKNKGAAARKAGSGGAQHRPLRAVGRGAGVPPPRGGGALPLSVP